MAQLDQPDYLIPTEGQDCLTITRGQSRPTADLTIGHGDPIQVLLRNYSPVSLPPAFHVESGNFLCVEQIARSERELGFPDASTPTVFH